MHFALLVQCRACGLEALITDRELTECRYPRVLVSERLRLAERDWYTRELES